MHSTHSHDSDATEPSFFSIKDQQKEMNEKN